MRHSAVFALVALFLIMIAVSSILMIPNQPTQGQFSTTTSKTSSSDSGGPIIGSTTTTTSPGIDPSTTQTVKFDPRIMKANGYFLTTPIDMMEWSDSQFSYLVEHLIESNVTYLFFNLSNLSPNGSLYDNFTLDMSLIMRFNTMAGAHSFQYIAWVGTQTDPNTLLGNFTNYGISETVTSLYKAGFDGILVDIEPVPNDSPQFLSMLQDFRASISQSAPGMLLAANNMNVYQSVAYGQLWAWDKNYFQNVTKLVNFISPMFFESDRTNQAQYVQYVDNEIQAVSQYSQAPVLYEIPDWYGPNTTNHFPLGENISNAIIAFQRYVKLAGEGQVPSPSNMLGLGIYGLNKTYTLEPGTVTQGLETTPHDWSFFINQWVNTTYPQRVGGTAP